MSNIAITATQISFLERFYDNNKSIINKFTLEELYNTVRKSMMNFKHPITLQNFLKFHSNLYNKQLKIPYQDVSLKDSNQSHDKPLNHQTIESEIRNKFTKPLSQINNIAKKSEQHLILIMEDEDDYIDSYLYIMNFKKPKDKRLQKKEIELMREIIKWKKNSTSSSKNTWQSFKRQLINKGLFTTDANITTQKSKLKKKGWLKANLYGQFKIDAEIIDAISTGLSSLIISKNIENINIATKDLI